MFTLNRDDLKDLCRGAAFLGTGGGGDPSCGFGVEIKPGVGPVQGARSAAVRPDCLDPAFRDLAVEGLARHDMFPRGEALPAHIAEGVHEILAAAWVGSGARVGPGPQDAAGKGARGRGVDDRRRAVEPHAANAERAGGEALRVAGQVGAERALLGADRVGVDQHEPRVANSSIVVATAG